MEQEHSLYEWLKDFGPAFKIIEWSQSFGTHAQYLWVLLAVIAGCAFAAVYWLVTAQIKKVYGAGRIIWIWLASLGGMFITWCAIRSGGDLTELLNPIDQESWEIFEQALRISGEFSAGFAGFIWGLSKVDGRKNVRKGNGEIPKSVVYQNALNSFEGEINQIRKKFVIELRHSSSEDLKTLYEEFADRLANSIDTFTDGIGIDKHCLPPIHFQFQNGDSKEVTVSDLVSGAATVSTVLSALMVPVAQTSGWWIFATTTSVPLLATVPPVGVVVALGALAIAGVGLARKKRKNKEEELLKESLIKASKDAFDLRIIDLKRWARQAVATASAIQNRQSDTKNLPATVVKVKNRTKRIRVGISILTLITILGAFFAYQTFAPTPALASERWLKAKMGNDAEIDAIHSIDKVGGDYNVSSKISYHASGKTSRVVRYVVFIVGRDGQVSMKNQ